MACEVTEELVRPEGDARVAELLKGPLKAGAWTEAVGAANWNALPVWET